MATTNCFTELLTNDILIDCENLAKGGIELDVLILPHRFIDKSATTINVSNRMIIDSLVLKNTEKALLLQGVKQLNGYNSEFVPSDDSIDRYRHTFRGVVVTPSAENRLAMSQLARGEQYAVVVNKKYKGANQEDAFLILGFDTGMYLTEYTEDSAESDAALLFTLSNKDEELEDEAPRNILETDYETTLTAFSNKFEGEDA